MNSAADHNTAPADAPNVVSTAVNALLERVRVLTGQLATLLTDRRDGPDASAPASVGSVNVKDAEAAWQQLREHPHLLWVPPVWRSQVDSDQAVAVARRRAVSAIDRNLTVDIGHDDYGEPWVRLATGALQDRPTSQGVDPTIATGTVDPKLDVKAPTFPEAVIRLRDALVANYGEPSCVSMTLWLSRTQP